MGTEKEAKKIDHSREDREVVLQTEARLDKMTDLEERLYVDFFMQHFPGEHSEAYRAEWRRRFKIDLGLAYGDKSTAKWLIAWIRRWMSSQIEGLDA